jgi:hypothetical protein
MPLKKQKSAQTQRRHPQKRFLHEGQALQLTIPELSELGTKKASSRGKMVPNQSNAQAHSKGFYEYKYVTKGDKVYGPYVYFRFWNGKRKCSRYLGKGPL